MFCECGCGEEAPLAVRTRARYGHVKGQRVRFIQGHNQRIPLEERFWSRVRPAGPEECWEWIGDKLKGYGRVSVKGKPVGAHRVAWILLRGEIPDGLTIEHECRKTDCVNPWHMDLWPNAKNAAGAINQYKDKTHCQRGHEFTEENTRRHPDGRRECRECGRATTRARYHRKRARQLIPA